MAESSSTLPSEAAEVAASEAAPAEAAGGVPAAACEAPDASVPGSASGVPATGSQAAADCPQPAGDVRTRVQALFEQYLNAMVQAITNADRLGALAAWRRFFHPDLAWSIATGVEPMLDEWRYCISCGHFLMPCLADATLADPSAPEGIADCHATLQRQYVGPCAMRRDVMRLVLTAGQAQDGNLCIIRQGHFQPSPRQVCGMPSHSQICQDLWVLHRLEKVGKDGVFLEVGANHAQELSNTYVLEKALQWRGLCVEPFPVGDWSGRSAELVKCAVGPEGGHLSFVAPGHVLGGLVDSVDMPRVQLCVPQEMQQVVEVATRTMASILREACEGGEGTMPPLIHYMSLDTEGSEYEILQGFPFDICTVLCITVEHNFKEPARSNIRSFLEERGFALDAAVEFDDFYLLRDYEKHLPAATVKPAAAAA